MPELLLICPICHSEDFDLLSKKADVYQCKHCTLGIQKEPRLDPSTFYTCTNYDKQREEVGGVKVWARFHHDASVAHIRLLQLASILQEFKKCDFPRWTDVGCGNAAFLCAARRAGYNTRGIELDEDFCETIEAVTGIRTVSTRQFLLSPAGYKSEIISFFDVIEHTLDPVGFLLQTIRAIDRGGIIIFEVPDLSQRDCVFDHWKHAKYSGEHLTHWTSLAFKVMLKHYFPQFEQVHEEIPVPGKLQLVWKRVKE